jgi:hypothetical protein
MIEQKVTGATAGAITAPALGALVVWIISEFTAVDMPFNIGEVLGALILAGAGALVAGWAKKSETSATSVAFDPRVAREAQADVSREKIIGDAGQGGNTYLLVIAICVVVALLFDWGLLNRLIDG